MIKLLVCCHKEGERGDDLLVTVQGGAALNSDICCDFRDDDGENISSLNPCYNELSVAYWAWKNYRKLGDPEYIGLMHYRRFFYADKKIGDAVLRTNLPKGLFRERSRLNVPVLLRYLGEGCFVCPRPALRRSVYAQYALTHDKTDLAVAIEILERLFPSYAKTAQKYLAGKQNFFYNMFIFPKEIFLRYCRFLFPILEEFVKRKGREQRLFVSERLTGIFFLKLMEEGMIPLFLPVLTREQKGEAKRAFISSWKSAKTVKQKLLALCRLFVTRKGERRRIR